MRRLRLGLVMLLYVAASGCRQPSDLVPVEGQITYGGGEWPTAGLIYFVPKAGDSPYRARPGTATFDKDGRFRAKTGTRLGLTPGTYSVQIDCWEQIPNPANIDGMSWIDKAYRAGPTEKYSVEVPASVTAPVNVQFDIPRRL